MTIYETWALVISSAAFISTGIISTVSLIKSSNTSKTAASALNKAAEAQASIAQIELSKEREKAEARKKANLTARMVVKYSLPNEKPITKLSLVLDNVGLAEARRVKCVVIGSWTQISLSAPSRNPVRIERLFDVIGPGTSSEIPLATFEGNLRCSGELNLELTWEDDTGKPGLFRTSLIFPN